MLFAHYQQGRRSMRWNQVGLSMALEDYQYCYGCMETDNYHLITPRVCLQLRVKTCVPAVMNCIKLCLYAYENLSMRYQRKSYVIFVF